VIRLVLKPVVPKQPTVLEAAKNLINSNFYGMNEVQYAALTELHKAIHREEANPTKPSKYDHIPQRLLDAIDPSAVDGGTRAILLVSDGGWAVKDFPAGVDTGKIYLWSGKYSIECVRDEIKQRGAANA